jgi:hypothetical protein
MKITYNTLQKAALIVAGVALAYTTFRNDPSPQIITNNKALPESVDSISESRDTVTKTLLEKSLLNYTDIPALSPDSLSKLINDTYTKIKNIDDSTIRRYVK